MGNDAVYPLSVFHFSVVLDGEELRFSEVSGLAMAEQDIESYGRLNEKSSSMKMSKFPVSSSITLKRGTVPTGSVFFEWLNGEKLNKPERKNLSISLLNEEHQPAMTWKVEGAWPVKVGCTSLASTGNDVAIEAIELEHEGLTVESCGH